MIWGLWVEDAYLQKGMGEEIRKTANQTTKQGFFSGTQGAVRANEKRSGNFSFDFVMSHVEERNHENTIFVGDLDQSVDEALLWELMIQVGPVGTISFPDRLKLSFLCVDNFPQYKEPF